MLCSIVCWLFRLCCSRCGSKVYPHKRKEDNPAEKVCNLVSDFPLPCSMPQGYLPGSSGTESQCTWTWQSGSPQSCASVAATPSQRIHPYCTPHEAVARALPAVLHSQLLEPQELVVTAQSYQATLAQSYQATIAIVVIGCKCQTPRCRMGCDSQPRRVQSLIVGSSANSCFAHATSLGFTFHALLHGHLTLRSS